MISRHFLIAPSDLIPCPYDEIPNDTITISPPKGGYKDGLLDAITHVDFLDEHLARMFEGVYVRVERERLGDHHGRVRIEGGDVTLEVEIGPWSCCRDCATEISDHQLLNHVIRSEVVYSHCSRKIDLGSTSSLKLASE